MTGRFAMVPLGDVLAKSEEWITLEPDNRYQEVTVRLWGKGVVQRREVTGAEIAARRRLVVRSQQFILSRIDARNGAFGLVPDSLDGAVVSNDFPVFAPNRSRILPTFLSWISKTRAFVDLCKAASEGTTNRVRLAEDRFLGMKIPLPSLDQQRKIVARIDELAAKIKEACSLRRRAADEVEALMASSITQALGGIPLDGHLGDIFHEKPKNGWSARCDNAESGVPVLSLGAVTGFRYRESEFKRTSEPTSALAHYWLRDGDLLITRSNTPELVGHAAIYNGSPNPCIYPDLMMRLNVDEEQADKRFVHYWLRSIPVREYIGHAAKGTSPTMKKLSQGAVTNIPFPARLSLPEQRRIVAYLNDLQAKIDMLEQSQTKTAAELDALLPSVLDEAFKGEL